jgi:hypothetical protein
MLLDSRPTLAILLKFPSNAPRGGREGIAGQFLSGSAFGHGDPADMDRFSVGTGAAELAGAAVVVRTQSS